MRWTLPFLALAALTWPLVAQQHDPDNKVAGGGQLPAGWSARTDKNAPMDNVKFAAMGADGWHFTTGPAVITWRDADATTGAFHSVATFTQTKAPMHPEAYGMFIGGKNLKSDTFSYTYFIIRGDGKYLVKKMAGGTATNVTNGWMDSDAIVKQDSAGKQTNKIEVSAGKDGKVSWKVNGKEVYAGTVTPAELMGAVGLRVNHNLDVHVAGFAVHKM